MARLNQVIAIRKGVKSDTYAKITEINKAFQKPALYAGLSKVYEPLDEEDKEKLPGERHIVQRSVDKDLKLVESIMSDYFDVEARREFTNPHAVADVKVDEQVILTGVPVGYLLFLEKQLNDLRSLVSVAPVLDPAETWTTDTSSGVSKTGVIRTHRNKKIQRPIVLYDATKEHPAQTAMVTEDVLAGHWATTKMSGAMKQVDRDLILERIDQLSRAVKQAREQANGVDEVPVPKVGSKIFDFLLEM